MEIDKFKIVCFVHNEQKKSQMGLVHAFGIDKYNNRINAFIQKKIFDYPNGDFSTNFGYDISEKPSFLLIKKDSVTPKFDLLEKDHWDILLVCDNFKSELKDYSPLIFSPDTLVMYHNRKPVNAENHLQYLLAGNKIKKYKQGRHEDTPDGGYQRLYELTKAWNIKNDNDEEFKFNLSEYDEAKKKIVEWFGVNDKLNAGLEFLHKSLGGIPASISILTRNGLFDLGKTVNGKTLQSWIDELKNKTGEAYKKALRDVRDVLLKEAGATGEN